MTQSTIQELLTHVTKNGYHDGVMTVLDLNQSVVYPGGDIITVRVSDQNNLLVGGLEDEDNSYILGIEELPDYVQNAVFCTAMTTTKNRNLTVSAETKLMGYLVQRNIINGLTSNKNGDGLYFGEIGNRLVVVRRDKESDTDLDSVGIRLVIYPDWDILHSSETFFTTLTKSLNEVKDYEAMGKLAAWRATGDPELRPRAVDIYYTDVDQQLEGCDYEYFDDEYEESQPALEEQMPTRPLSHITTCESYKVMIDAAKRDLVNKIAEAYSIGMNIPHDLPIGVTSMEGEGGNMNGFDGIDGVTLTEDDSQTEMQLSFVCGYGSELPPAYSHEWNLDDLTLETLIYIYTNMRG